MMSKNSFLYYEYSHAEFDFSFRSLGQQQDQEGEQEDFGALYDDMAEATEIVHDSYDRLRYGEIVPRITGSLSAVASMLIIFLILRSSTHLSSSYHRIMVGMSVCDVLSSTAMAFTHLPMPRPGLSPAVDAYMYQGLRLGNTQTCSAQGFIYTVGILGTYTYNTGLCIYYACAIFFKLKKQTIRNRVESVIHVSVIFYFLVPIIALYHGNINPVDAHCGIAPLPATCNSDIGNCERGSSDKNIPTTVLVILAAMTIFLLTTVSLGLVCRTVFSDGRKIKKQQIERRQQQQQNPSLNLTSSLEEEEKKHLVSNKFIVLQALAYIGALLITIFFPLLTAASSYAPFGKGYDYASYRSVLKKLHLIFQPMQGFFNFLIFMTSKIYQQRCIDGDQSIVDIVKKMFKKKYDDPIIISRLSLMEGNLPSQNMFEVDYYYDYDRQDDNNNNNNGDDLSVDDEDKPTDTSSPHATYDGNMDGISYPSSGVSPPDMDGHSALSLFSWFSRSRRDSAVSSTGISHGPALTDGGDSKFHAKPENDGPNNTKKHAGTHSRFKRRSVLEDDFQNQPQEKELNNNFDAGTPNTSNKNSLVIDEESVPVHDVPDNNYSRKNSKKKKSKRIDKASDPPAVTRKTMKRHSSFREK